MHKQTLALNLSVFLLALVAIRIHGNPINKYSGDWLAKELGMDNANIASQALNDLKNGDVRLKATAQPNGVSGGATNVPQRDRKSFMEKMNSKNFDGALKEIDAAINKMVSSGIVESNQSQVGLLASLRFDRVHALKALNRYIEALIEAQKIDQLIPQGDSRKAMLRNFFSSMEREMSEKTMGPYRVLQMDPSGNVKTAYRKMMLLLHPDKNANLNGGSTDYIKRLYDTVRDAYEHLSKRA